MHYDFIFKISKKLFNPAYIPFLDAMQRIQIFFGGSSSGKSKFLAQRCIWDIINGGRNYLILRNVQSSLRGSTFNEILKVIHEWKLQEFFKINKTEMVITCIKNECQIIFKGLDDPEKIKSATPLRGVITDIWVEEATECQLDAIMQLGKRLRGRAGGKRKRITLSFNPINKTHWIYARYFSGIWQDDDKMYVAPDGKLLIVKTTYEDNIFLEDDDIAELLDESDSYYYDVYTLGKWGVLGKLVFSNWTVEDLSDIKDEFDYHQNGVDFGYTIDPATFVKTARKGDTIYIFDEIYEREMSNEVLASRIKPLAGSEQVFCDSAEPKSIDELCEYGVNAVPSLKGKDSVSFGIQWLQKHKIVVDKRCQNAINELGLYQWKKNLKGEYVNTPIDKDNHIPDALRYAWSERIMKPEYKKVNTRKRREGAY